MANTKISALTSASTPLAGTEVLPIVQSSATVKVATNDLTVRNVRANATTGILQVTGPAAASTRVMTVPDANFTAARTDAAQSFTGDQTLSTGNIIQGTAAKGVNFTANTPAAGMTSQLLNWYEEGSFTPVLTCATPGTLAVVYNTQRGRYQRVGNVCHTWINIQTDSVTLGTASGAVRITGLPFTSSLNGVESSMGAMMFQGITKAGYTQFSPQAIWTTTYMQIIASATALNASNLAIGELGAGTNLLNIYVAFIVA
jgi:hypothetical protein